MYNVVEERLGPSWCCFLLLALSKCKRNVRSVHDTTSRSVTALQLFCSSYCTSQWSQQTLADQVTTVLWSAYMTASPASDTETAKQFATVKTKMTRTKWNEFMVSSWQWIIFIAFFFFFYIFSFALNTLIPLPCSKESNCQKKSFQDLFPSLQERLNSPQENTLISLCLLILLWDHSFILKAFIKLNLKSQWNIWEGPLTSINCRWDLTSTTRLVLIKLYIGQTTDLTTEVRLTRFFMEIILNSLKSNEDVYYIKSTISVW